MFRALHRQFPLRLDYGRSPHAYVNQRLQIQLELLMMSGVPLEICWAFNERWNNKFCYKVASCWLFLLNHTTMHGSMNMGMFSFGDLDVAFLQTNNSRFWLSAGNKSPKKLCGIQIITSNITVYGTVTMAVPHCLQTSSPKHGWKLYHKSCVTSLTHLKFVLRLN